MLTDLVGEDAPAGGDRARREPRRRRRHARRARRGRLLLVPGLAAPAALPVPVLYSVPVPRASTETEPAGRLRRRGPARAVAAATVRAPARRRSSAAVETLPGVGPSSARSGSRGSACARSAICWPTGRAATSGRSTERRSRDLFGDEEAVIEGVVRATSSRRGRGRLKILTARIADGTGEIRATWFNQPWLEEQLTPGTRVRLRGKLEPLRLPGRELRPRRGDRDRRLRAGLPGQRGARAEAAARARRRGARARPRRRAMPLPAALASAEGLPLRGRRTRRAAPAALARGGGGGPAPARLRRAARAPARARAPGGRAGGARRDGAARRPASCSQRYREVLPFTLTERAGAGDRRDRRRSRADDADAAAAAGRRRLWEDGGRALRRSCAPSRPAARAR